MADRLDALCVRESNGKSFFTRIGVAFPAKQGGGWSVLLDAMPAPSEGQFKILLREPLPPREQQGQRSYSGNYPDTGSGGNHLDDDVPGF